MDKSYRFTSDTEPTDEQLEELMLAVLEDVIDRAAKAEAKYKILQAEHLQQTIEIWKLRQEQANAKRKT